MTANAAVRAGAGLVSLYVTPDAYPVIAAAVMPEVMTAPVEDDGELLERCRTLDVLAIGPGLGPNARRQEKEASTLLALIEHFPGLMVVDADALNLLAAAPSSPSGTRLQALHRRSGPRLLTPHPGEMRRLFPASEALPRHETANRFLALFATEPGSGLSEAKPPLTLLLKGSRTLVAEGSRRSYNSTGNPGMATGGMGDVLTGVCAALAGQGLYGFDAARVGAWVCGRAAEKAVMHGWRSHESLSATDLLEFFGGAFEELRGGGGTF
jgi:NAD(P)H-hydrate epimerase